MPTEMIKSLSVYFYQILIIMRWSIILVLIMRDPSRGSAYLYSAER